MFYRYFLDDHKFFINSVLDDCLRARLFTTENYLINLTYFIELSFYKLRKLLPKSIIFQFGNRLPKILQHGLIAPNNINLGNHTWV